MTADLEPDVYPSCKYDFDTLMFCFCAKSARRRAGSPDGNWRGSGAALASAVAGRAEVGTENEFFSTPNVI